jgi:hypothetical protein
MSNITFGPEISWPLTTDNSIIEEHYGYIEHVVCDKCGTDFVHQYELDEHKCPFDKPHVID